MALAQRIADGLAARRLSLRSGAAKIVCSPAHLMRITKGDALPDYAMLLRIADTIGEQRDRLVGEWLAEHARSAGAAPPPDVPASVASMWASFALAYPIVAREIEVVGTIEENGDLRIERRYRGVRPTHELLEHRIVQERAVGVEPVASTSTVVLDSAPRGLNVDVRSSTTAGWRVHALTFSPAWSPDSAPLSYTIHSRLPGAYATTRGENHARVTREPSANTDAAPIASHACRLNDSAERLFISVASPHDEQWLDPEAWQGPGPNVGRSILDRLCVYHEQVVGPRSCQLTIERPLPGHWYSVRWAARLA